MYCGSDPNSPAASLHLQLAEVKLPGLDEQYTDHHSTGAPIAIELDTFIQRMECSFLCAGWQPQVAELINSWAVSQNVFTIYGLIRDKFGGAGTPGGDIQVAATIVGRLGQADPQNWRRGDIHHWQYSIRSIVSYQLMMGTEPIYDWDFKTNRFFVNGTDMNAALNSNLVVPAQANIAQSGQGSTSTGG
jgi:phage tail tube protein FII